MKYLRSISLTIIFAFLSSACTSKDIDQYIPKGFAIQEIQYTDTDGYDCTTKVAKIDKSATQLFLEETPLYSNDFLSTESEGLYEDWKATPMPDDILYGMSVRSKLAILGPDCQYNTRDENVSKLFRDYRSLYFKLIDSEGAYYSYMDDGRSLIVFYPVDNLLFFIRLR